MNLGYVFSWEYNQQSGDTRIEKTNIAVENGAFIDDLSSKLETFRSYVSLPQGTYCFAQAVIPAASSKKRHRMDHNFIPQPNWAWKTSTHQPEFHNPINQAQSIMYRLCPQFQPVE